MNLDLLYLLKLLSIIMNQALENNLQPISPL